jgi:pimeloyl-ACP methyl ester carboxylesterase
MNAIPIALLHGLAVSNEQTRPTAERLGPRHPVMLIDLPDADVARPAEGASLLEANVVAALERLEQASHDAWVVLGSSLGSQVAIELALRSPRVRGIVLAPPVLDAAPPRPWRQLGRLLRASIREPLATNLLVTRAWLSQWPLGRIRLFREALVYPTEAQLARVDVPVLMVVGTRDALVPPGWVERLRQRTNLGKVAWIEDASHALPHAEPDALAAATEAFIAEEVLR